MHVQTQQKPWHVRRDHELRVALNLEYGKARCKGEETNSPAGESGLKEPREPGAEPLVACWRGPSEHPLEPRTGLVPEQMPPILRRAGQSDLAKSTGSVWTRGVWEAPPSCSALYPPGCELVGK